MIAWSVVGINSPVSLQAVRVVTLIALAGLLGFEFLELFSKELQVLEQLVATFLVNLFFLTGYIETNVLEELNELSVIIERLQRSCVSPVRG
jgi:hypothetical protein